MSKYYMISISHFRDQIERIYAENINNPQKNILSITNQELQDFALNMIHSITYSCFFIDLLHQENDQFKSSVLLFIIVSMAIFYLSNWPFDYTQQ